jgi:hypothetical protein
MKSGVKRKSVSAPPRGVNARERAGKLAEDGRLRTARVVEHGWKDEHGIAVNPLKHSGSSLLDVVTVEPGTARSAYSTAVEP